MASVPFSLIRDVIRVIRILLGSGVWVVAHGREREWLDRACDVGVQILVVAVRVHDIRMCHACRGGCRTLVSQRHLITTTIDDELVIGGIK